MSAAPTSPHHWHSPSRRGYKPISLIPIAFGYHTSVPPSPIYRHYSSSELQGLRMLLKRQPHHSFFKNILVYHNLRDRRSSIHEPHHSFFNSKLSVRVSSPQRRRVTFQPPEHDHSADGTFLTKGTEWGFRWLCPTHVISIMVPRRGLKLRPSPVLARDQAVYLIYYYISLSFLWTKAIRFTFFLVFFFSLSTRMGTVMQTDRQGCTVPWGITLLLIILLSSKLLLQ